MGLFNRTVKAPEDQTSREYLASAPPGPRTTALAASCVLQIAEIPLAGRERFGEVLTVAALEPASELVRNIMIQDRDLSAWIARKSIIQLKYILGSSAMSGDFGRDFDLGWAGVGLLSSSDGPVIHPDSGATLSDEDLGGAVGFGQVVGGLLLLFSTTPEERRSSSGWSVYEDLYTGASGEDAETLGYDITAWVSVLLARLLNTERASNIPFLGPEYRQAPPLPRPGWYPNPGKTGDITNGDAQFQRFWDGAWTDRVRIREGREWNEGSLSLHAPPKE
ncbi:MAG: hypothetical protein WAU77_00830 [Solirubrobacteraceae bacterium]